MIFLPRASGVPIYLIKTLTHIPDPTKDTKGCLLLLNVKVNDSKIISLPLIKKTLHSFTGWLYNKKHRAFIQ